MKVVLTILFSLFAIFSLWGAVSDPDKEVRDNLTWAFVITITSIVALNIL